MCSHSTDLGETEASVCCDEKEVVVPCDEVLYDVFCMIKPDCLEDKKWCV